MKEQSYLELLVRLAANFVAIILIVRYIYYPKHRNKEFLFTFSLFNIVIFLLCFLLSSAQLELSFAFGLFAIFSIIRYRTVTIPVREMGYFFLCVALGIVNALIVVNDNYVNIILTNIIFIVTIFLLDRRIDLKHENYRFIILDRLDMVHEDRRVELIDDLKVKTGIEFHRIEIMRLDYFKETARIKAFFYSNRAESHSGTGDDED